MKPQKLIICGWGPYKDKVEIDFDKFHNRGLFLITGATGAGKTTIFDAISYALYGSLSGEVRDKERHSVRSDFATPDTPTYVELEMVHAQKKYRIVRNPEYMRPKKNASKGNPFTKEKENAVLYSEGRVIEGVKEVNTYIRDLLSLDYQQFKQLSMIAQGEFAKLLTAPPKDKTKIFREIFGTGIYERFTANLAMTAKKHYLLIAEQKNKLEEDLRLLAGTVQEMGLQEEKREHFCALLSAEYPNYEQIGLSMEDMEAEAAQEKAELQKAFEKSEKQLEKKNALLVKQKEENKRIQELQKALQREQELDARKDEFDRKAVCYQKAINAGWVEAADVNRKQVKGRLQATETEYSEVFEALERDRVLLIELKDFWVNREACKAVIETMAEYEKLKGSLQGLKKKHDEHIQLLEQGREKFFQKEAHCLEIKHNYEEAVRVQKYAAIGVAVSMLVDGKACPVCGSKEHPKPAKPVEGILSEEETEHLKQVYEKEEKECHDLHIKLVTIQTREEELRKRLEEELLAEVTLKEALERVCEPVCKAFMELSASEAEKQWQDKYNTVQRLQTMAEQREERLERLLEQKSLLNKESLEAQESFKVLLVQYGFAKEQEYYEAYLSKQEREALGTSLDKYQQELNATKEIVKHLQQAVTSRELLNTAELEEEISAERRKKEDILRNLKKWERFLSELKRTRKLFAQKQDVIALQSKEYGRIKELENIASGNNVKKLVFEQYVLAGYFEQILQAANIRFRKMTLGRYEMHRSKEVGDGRVKDNMEIEVMDFYTGKERSVRTLSGGESFKASLSLALGLSDVIQAMSGGIRVDTLFIDEGFGALDTESLDQACTTLMELVESERLIGIISHVSELRERIDRQIVIDKTGGGSTLKVVIN